MKTNQQKAKALKGEHAQRILKDAGSYGILAEDQSFRRSLSDAAKAIFLETLHSILKAEDQTRSRSWKDLAPVFGEDADQLEAALKEYYRGTERISQGVKMQIDACF